jgi:hypothetical protein
LRELDDRPEQLLGRHRQLHGAEAIERQGAHPTFDGRIVGDLLQRLAWRRVR